MSTQGLEYNSLRGAVRDWRSVRERMTTLSSDMAGYDPGGLPASVQGEAQRFLDSWSDLAAESADLAGGYADAVQATLDDFTGEDELSASEIGDLEGSVRG
ncbi:hypothetical protein [uncultured Nocardioides sp.]|uniref:hypothetical protein n=1 Tax=uncultured Nocardioides sp. TaxID=198441 RepID=UPI0026242642|nr:hypothetical protein [uncultured Nocardioides sp.]